MLDASAIAPVPLADSTSNVLQAISSLAWPAIVLTAIIMFQSPLRAAIGRVSEVDVGSTKVVLQKQADDAANTTKSVIGTGVGAPDTPPIIAEAKTNATKAPASSVLDAWTGVENATRQAAQDAPGVTSPSVADVVNAYVQSKDMDSSLVPVAKTLESLRAVAAGEPKMISAATATSFVSAADDLARLIKKAA